MSDLHPINVQRLARGKTVARINSRNRGQGVGLLARLILLALLAALLAAVVWLIRVTPALSATQPPTRYPVLCHVERTGKRPQSFTLGSTYRLHRWGHGDEPATWNARREQWECK